MLLWKAPKNITEIAQKVKEDNHSRLSLAVVTVALSDEPAFKKNKFNWGKVSKFSNFNKLWQNNHKIDFCITLSSDVWHSILNMEQKEALIDLHLTRCDAERVPEVIEENGKKKKVVDELGRIKYSNEIKLDEDGNPKWVVNPLGLEAFIDNVKRYGLWCDELNNFKSAINE